MRTKALLFLIFLASLNGSDSSLTLSYSTEDPDTYSDPKPRKRQYKPFITGSFLYWSTSEDGTDFVTQCNAAPLTNLGLVIGGSSESIGLGMAPGFRVGLGAHFPWQNTTGSLNYTWLRANNSKNISAPTDQLLFPTLAIPALAPTYVTGANGTWTLLFQNGDADFERTYIVNDVLSLSPRAGVKLAWINQTRSINYTGYAGDDTFGNSVINGTYTSQDKNNFWGAGLKLGATTDWNLGAEWHLSGMLNGALLVGSFDITQLQTINSQTALNFSSDLTRITPTLQFDVGIDWSHYLEKIKFQIRVAYEAQYWWGQNQLAYYTATLPYYYRENGNLAFQGLTTSITFTF